MRSRILVLFGALSAILIGAAPVTAATGGGPGGVVITVSPTGTVSHGTATISGTITCSPLWAAPVQVSGDIGLNQPVGRLHSVNGDVPINMTIDSCDSPVSWQVTVFPFNGRYASGTAFVQVSLFGCDEVPNCDQGSLTTIIRLKAH